MTRRCPSHSVHTKANAIMKQTWPLFLFNRSFQKSFSLEIFILRFLVWLFFPLEQLYTVSCRDKNRQTFFFWSGLSDAESELFVAHLNLFQTCLSFLQIVFFHFHTVLCLFHCIPFSQVCIGTPWWDLVERFANIVDFPPVHRYYWIRKFLIADVTGFLQPLVDRLDVLVQVWVWKSLVAERALSGLIVVHLSHVPCQVAHSKLLLTMWTRLLNPLVLLSHVPPKVVHADFFLALFALRFLSKVNALNVAVQHIFLFEGLIAIGTLQLLAIVRSTHMSMQVIAFLATNIASWSFTQMDLSNHHLGAYRTK